MTRVVFVVAFWLVAILAIVPHVHTAKIRLQRERAANSHHMRGGIYHDQILPINKLAFGRGDGNSTDDAESMLYFSIKRVSPMSPTVKNATLILYTETTWPSVNVTVSLLTGTAADPTNWGTNGNFTWASKPAQGPLISGQTTIAGAGPYGLSAVHVDVTSAIVSTSGGPLALLISSGAAQTGLSYLSTNNKPSARPEIQIAWEFDCSGRNDCSNAGICVGLNVCKCNRRCHGIYDCSQCDPPFYEVGPGGTPLEWVKVWLRPDLFGAGPPLSGYTDAVISDAVPMFMYDTLPTFPQTSPVYGPGGNRNELAFDGTNSFYSPFGLVADGGEYPMNVYLVHTPDSGQNNMSYVLGVDGMDNGWSMGTYFAENSHAYVRLGDYNTTDYILQTHPGSGCANERVMMTSRCLSDRLTMRTGFDRTHRVDHAVGTLPCGINWREGAFSLGHLGDPSNGYKGKVNELLVVNTDFANAGGQSLPWFSFRQVYFTLKYKLQGIENTWSYITPTTTMLDYKYGQDFTTVQRYTSTRIIAEGQSSVLLINSVNLTATDGHTFSAGHDGGMPDITDAGVGHGQVRDYRAQYIQDGVGGYRYSFNRTWSTRIYTTTAHGTVSFTWKLQCLRCVPGSGDSPFAYSVRDNDTSPWVGMGYFPRASCGRFGNGDERYASMILPNEPNRVAGVGRHYRFSFDGEFVPEQGVENLNGTYTNTPIITWTPHANASHYVLERSDYPIPGAKTPRLAWTTVWEHEYATNQPAIMSFNDTSANPGYKYLYRMRVGSCGPLQTDGPNITVITPGTPFTRVYNPTSGANVEGHVTLFWDYNYDATMTRYEVYRQTVGTPGPFVLLNGTLPGELLQYTDETTTSATSYLYKIVSCNPFGCDVGTTILGNVQNLVPVITNVSPLVGSDCGGTFVTLSGFNFGPAPINLTTIAVGGKDCSNAFWNTPYQALCVIAPDTPAGTVVATNTIGSSLPSVQSFTINPRPVVTDFSPKSGLSQVSQTVTITGNNLAQSAVDLKSVSIAGVPCATQTWNGVNQVTCVTGKAPSPVPLPAVAPLTGPVTVESISACAGSLPGYTYIAPMITALSPTIGPFTGGTEVQVYGANFGSLSNMQQVTFKGVPCSGLRYISDTHMSCITSVGVNGTGRAVMTTVDGGQGHYSPNVFWNYVPPWPEIFSVNPSVAFLDGGQVVAVSGVEFGFSRADVVSVSLAGIPCTNIIWDGPSELRCTAGNSTGLRVGQVSVTTSLGGPSQGVPVEFRYIARLDISPAWGPAAGGTMLRVIGAGIAQDRADLVSIVIGTTNCTLESDAFISTKEVQCRQPPMPAQLYFVTVTTKSNGALIVGQYGVRLPTPVIDRISPFQVNEFGGDVITLYGSNFGDIPSGQVVAINKVPCISTVWLSPSRATCEVPPEFKVPGGEPYYITLAVAPQAAESTGTENDIVAQAISVPTDVGLKFVPPSQICDPRCDENAGFDPFRTECRDLTCVCRRWYSGLPLCKSYSVNVVQQLPVDDTDASQELHLNPSEDGDAAKFEVSLDKLPLSIVTVGISSTVPREARPEPSMLLFTQENYLVPQIITVKGVNDKNRDQDQLLQIGFRVQSADPHYDAMPLPNVNLTNHESRPKLNALNPALSPLSGGNITIYGTDFDFNVGIEVGGVRVPADQIWLEVRSKADAPLTGTTPTTATSSLLQSTRAGEVVTLGELDQRAGESLLQLNSGASGHNAIDNTKYIHRVSFIAPAMTGGYHELKVSNLDALNMATLKEVLYYTDDCPVPGYFGRGKDCRPCPEGGICPGGYRIWPKPGYWNSGEQSGSVSKCNPPERCLGHTQAMTRINPASGQLINTTCAVGYTGQECGSCEVGYYALNTACEECPASESIYAILVTDIIVWLSVGVASWAVEDRENFSHIIALILALQEVGAIGGLLPQTMPQNIIRIFEFFHLFTGDIDFLKPDCSSRPDIVQAAMIKMAYSVAIGSPMWLGMPIAKWFSVRRHKERGPEYMNTRRNHYVNRHWRVLAVHITLIYFSLTNNALTILACKQVDSGIDRKSIVLMSDPDTVCWQGNHAVVASFSLLIVLCVTIGWPVGYFLRMRRQSVDRLYQDPSYYERNDYLYEPFLPQFRYGFFMELGVLVFLAMGQTFLIEDPVASFTVVGGALFLNQLWLTIVKPYERQWEGNVLALLNFCNLLTTILIFISTTNSLSPQMLTALAWLLVLCIALVVTFQCGVVIYFVFWKTTQTYLEKETYDEDKVHSEDEFDDIKPWYNDHFNVPDLDNLRDEFHQSRNIGTRRDRNHPTQFKETVGGYGLLASVTTTSEGSEDGAHTGRPRPGGVMPEDLGASANAVFGGALHAFTEPVPHERRVFDEDAWDDALAEDETESGEAPPEAGFHYDESGMRVDTRKWTTAQDLEDGFDLGDGIFDPDGSTVSDSETSDLGAPEIPLDLTHSQAPPELAGIDEDGMRVMPTHAGPGTAEVEGAGFDEDGMRI